MPLELYAHPFSSYCQKAFIAFYEKDVPFTLRLLSQDDPVTGAEFSALWPLERMPLLKVDGKAIFESTIIVEWVDQHYPGGTRLIPSAPDKALDARMRDRIFDNYVMTPMQTIVFDRIRSEEVRDAYGVARARALLDKSYAWLDREMATRTWAAGDDFTLADCAAAPSLFYANWVHPIEGHANLTAYLKRLWARPSFARAIEGGRPYRHFFPGGAPTDRG